MSKQGVMERISWYQELRKLFSMYSEQNIILKAKLLQCLTERLEVFPLKSPQEYNTSTSIQGFSFEVVYNQIQTMPRAVKWDEILDSFAYLSIYTKRSEGTGLLNLVPVKPEKPAEEKRPREKGTLKEDFPLVKSYSLSEIPLGSNLKFLSLGGNLISNAIFEFPISLIALNLSYNIITDFQPIKPLSNLKFLNLSHNNIETMPDITSIITLNELFISKNKLNTANFLFSIKNLSILDLQYNLIENFEDLAMLSVSSKLTALALAGNPIYNKQGYTITIRGLFSRCANLDHKDMQFLSSFKQIGFSEEPDANGMENGVRKNMGGTGECRVATKVDDRKIVVSSDNYRKISKGAYERSNSIEARSGSGHSGTQKSTNCSSAKHIRSRSNGHNGSLPTTPSLCNTSHKKHKSIVVSKNSTSKMRFKVFGDPLSAMMIGPPAVKNIFKQTSNGKKFSIDLSKIRNSKIRKSP